MFMYRFRLHCVYIMSTLCTGVYIMYALCIGMRVINDVSPAFKTS